MNSIKLIHYEPRKTKPQIIFTIERLDTKDLIFAPERFRELKSRALSRLEAMINYTTSNFLCRSQQLLSYFGEEKSKRCGKCDSCISLNRLDMDNFDAEAVIDIIKPKLLQGWCSLNDLGAEVGIKQEDAVLQMMDWLSDNGWIERDENYNFRWKQKEK